MSLHEDPLQDSSRDRVDTEETEQTYDDLLLIDDEEEEDTMKKTPITALLHAIIDRFQRIRIKTKNAKTPEGDVQLISGLDEVVFGTKGAADAISLCGLRPPRYAWFVLSGMFCDVIQLALDMTLHFVLGLEDASVCWFGGFVLSIIVRHTSHRYLVFGAHVGGYFYSLFRLYLGYSFSIALSTLFDAVATKSSVQLSHYVAWGVTLLWTGAFNYFMLKLCWGKKKDDDEDDDIIKADDNDKDEMVPLAKSLSDDHPDIVTV